MLLKILFIYLRGVDRGRGKKSQADSPGSMDSNLGLDLIMLRS